MQSIYQILANPYDPLGYIVPLTTRAKVLVQRLQDKKGEWDDTRLPEDIIDSWKHWESELEGLQDIALPRYYCSKELALLVIGRFTSSVMPQGKLTDLWLT